MNVIIERVYLEQETLSSLYVFNGAFKAFSCKALEPPNKENKHNISCIPLGTYWVTKELTSPGHDYPHFRVHDVPDRNGILWHGGNYFKDTLGCLLVGDSFGDRNKDGVLDVLNSRTTLQKLFDLLPDKFQATYKMKP
jgi:hypothetical protein